MVKPGCIINPQTGRAVRTDGPLGKKLLAQAEQLDKEYDARQVIKKVAKRAVVKKPEPPKPKTESEQPKPKQKLKPTKHKEKVKKPLDKEWQIRREGARVLQAAVKRKLEALPVIKDTEDTPFVDGSDTATGKYKLSNRIKNILEVKALLKDIKDDDCIEPKDKGYTVRDIINLEKKIGTASAYGVIYLTSIKGYDKTKLACKLFEPTKDNTGEIELMDKLTKELITPGKSPHFLALYNNTLCKDKKIGNKKRPDKLKLLSINELAHGDLKGLVENADVMKDVGEVIGLLTQCFISLATFQNKTGMSHNDTHYGNFLYQKNIETGYYHYKLGPTDYYVEASKYNIMLYDFGLAKKFDSDWKGGFAILGDYYRIVNAFINKKDGGWCEGNFIHGNLSKLMVKIKETISKMNVRDDAKSMPRQIIEYIARESASITTSRKGSVINAIPFEI
tara:strand:+ start:760 stop:2106 length:1347 start_codon:yes stop_codon:yes gene_type:complete